MAVEDGVCSTDILVIRAKSPEWTGFLTCVLSGAELVEYASAVADGTRMPRTNWRDLANYETPLPPPVVATAFNRCVVPLVESICHNIHESRTLTATRDALLPKLISGEIRVKDGEKIADGHL